MNGTEDAGDEPDTRTAIMEVTYAALCKRGYAGLTMLASPDEFDFDREI